MVDVTDKAVTHRKALAVGEIILGSTVIEMIKNKTMPKGDPLTIAEVSGINGVKKNKRTYSSLSSTFFRSYFFVYRN